MPGRHIDWYGARLRAVREQRGLSPAELGRRVGLAGSQINQMEANVNRPTLATALALAEALGVPITEFVAPHSAIEAAAQPSGKGGGPRGGRPPRATQPGTPAAPPKGRPGHRRGRRQKAGQAGPPAGAKKGWRQREG